MARAVLEIVGRAKPARNEALSDLIKELMVAGYDADDVLNEMDNYRLRDCLDTL